ncbi:MAG: poly-beta-1,6-N-acetyl-D-glucosamine biosynthesis protein PgaD [Rudaea sp.]|uniref:poly-beta-1,6-N-acetyl-D-glucosamine biosynthesis protein PgaD n=1 Tax=Rudaea sp. TaxID=2136325 RepID=UPI0039E29B26
MNSVTPIISRPERQSLAQRSLYSALTFVAWITWLYLWTPILTAFAWLLGLIQAYDQIALGESGNRAHDVFLLGSSAAACAIILLAWANYNRIRFAGKERRRHIVDVSPERIVDFFSCNPETAHDLRNARRSVLHLDEQGMPLFAHTTERIHAATPHIPGDTEHGYDLRPFTALNPEELLPNGDVSPE